MSSRKWLERALNLCIILALAYVLFRPSGGLLYSWVANKRAESRLRSQIGISWSSMISRVSRLDSAGVGEQVVAIEFGDYQCPGCRAVFPIVERLMKEKPEVAVGYLHYPIPGHEHAEAAAAAAVCAERVGKFRQMHARLMSTTEWERSGNWIAEASAIGITDTLSFSQCLKDSSTATRIRNDKDLGVRLGIRATPTFVHRGGMKIGGLTKEDVERMR